MMKRMAGAIGIMLSLAACGNRTDLQPKVGQTLPVKPVFAPKTPTVSQLLTPDSQARPQRSDEQLDRSRERRDDKFDLPPAG
jgi:hypothetical protein